MLRTNTNTIEGERARTASQLLLFDGVVRQWDRGLQRYLLLREICGTSLPRSSRRPAATSFRCSNSQLEPRFILDLQERVKHVKCCLTPGLEGLDVEFFLHKEQRAQPRQRCRLRPGAPLKKGHHGTVWTKLLRSYVLLYHNVLQAGVAGVFSALHQMWKAWCKQEKKSVGSWFHAESASPFGGELSWKYYFIIFIWY